MQPIDGRILKRSFSRARVVLGIVSLEEPAFRGAAVITHDFMLDCNAKQLSVKSRNTPANHSVEAASLPKGNPRFRCWQTTSRTNPLQRYFVSKGPMCLSERTPWSCGLFRFCRAENVWRILGKGLSSKNLLGGCLCLAPVPMLTFLCVAGCCS